MHRNPQVPTSASPAPAQQAKNDATKKPSKDDVHEQREVNQKQEGIVAAPRAPAQSQIDQERGDWEGMAQAQQQPEEDEKRPAQPTPGSNSLAGSRSKKS